jgi:transposase
MSMARRAEAVQRGTVKLTTPIAPPCVKASVKSPKNDARDAEAIGEAVTRPTMRFVPIKQVEQQDLQALHRIRERLIKARTALINEIRGLLNEDGMVLPQSLAKFRALIVDKLREEQAKLTTLSTEVFWHLYDELLAVETRLAYDDEQLAAIGQAHPACQRLQTIPGIGPVRATALIVAVGDVTQFTNGRQLAAWLGLVPREHSTGGQPRLLGISTRGDRYRRKLLVHGARATLRWVDTKCDGRSQWLKSPHRPTRKEPGCRRVGQSKRPNCLGAPGAQPSVSRQHHRRDLLSRCRDHRRSSTMPGVHLN